MAPTATDEVHARKRRPLTATTPAQPATVRFARPLPPELWRLQQVALQATLGALGVRDVPGVLLVLARDAPVSEALSEFCTRFELSRDAILTPSHPTHEENRYRLVDVCRALVAAERPWIARSSRLPIAPLYEASGLLEDRVGRLRKAIALEVTLSTPVDLGRTRSEWVSMVRDLKTWATASLSDLEELERVASIYLDLETKFQTSKATLDKLLGRLREERTDLPDIIEHFEKKAAAVMERSKLATEEPAAILEDLGPILIALRRLLSETPTRDEPPLGDRTEEPTPPKPPPASDGVSAEELELLRDLNLTPDAVRRHSSRAARLRVLKSAYRTQVKRYHPDRKPGDPERFRRVVYAWNTLRAVYESTKES